RPRHHDCRSPAGVLVCAFPLSQKNLFAAVSMYLFGAINRNNAMQQSLRRGLLIRGVGATSSRLRGVLPEVSQGSSLLATLGFIAESLWDSRLLASNKIRVGCSEDGRTPLTSYVNSGTLGL